MIYEISSIQDPRVAVFATMTETQLRNRLNAEQGLFIAESPKVIRVALQAGYEPVALLCERKHIDGDAADIISQCPSVPVYTGDRETLSCLTGYTLTRGILCAMRRKPEPLLTETLRSARRVCVIDSVCDTTNIGAIFRSAAALGIDAVCFKTAAMALTDKSIPLSAPILKQQERLAIIMGTEGEGLPQKTIEDADFTVRIPMYHQVDSLNVAAAAAVAFWELAK